MNTKTDKEINLSVKEKKTYKFHKSIKMSPKSKLIPFHNGKNDPFEKI